jgi:hypothetical protein
VYLRVGSTDDSILQVSEDDVGRVNSLILWTVSNVCIKILYRRWKVYKMH